MPSFEHLVAFAIASFILIVIPGPSVLFTVSRALAYGRRVALTTVLGGAAGSFTGQVTVQMIILGAVFAVIALAMDSVWGTAAGAVRSWFARSARRLDLVGGAAGLTMIGLGVGLAISGRKD
jgi:threonine/homoserine/homoserine lactone efflux protein